MFTEEKVLNKIWERAHKVIEPCPVIQRGSFSGIHKITIYFHSFTMNIEQKRGLNNEVIGYSCEITRESTEQVSLEDFIEAFGGIKRIDTVLRTLESKKREEEDRKREAEKRKELILSDALNQIEEEWK